jgi:hypothetical protein
MPAGNLLTSCFGITHDTAWQVRQYRIKAPPIEALSQMAIFHKNGRPHILSHDAESRIPTLHLSCTCEGALSSGLPCTCMLAVARSVGGVLSLHHYNPHWLSMKLIDFPKPAPLFVQNKRRVLMVEEVVEHAHAEAAPSTVPDHMTPMLATVIGDVNARVDGDSVVTLNGEPVQLGQPLEGAETGAAKSRSKRSRRFQ